MTLILFFTGQNALVEVNSKVFYVLDGARKLIKLFES